MSAITTHVLNTALGRPAAGVAVTLQKVDPDTVRVVGRSTTDADGRVRDLVAGDSGLEAGDYQLDFDTAGYFKALGTAAFYPTVVIRVTVSDPTQHYHVPLLLSPFGYSTYRGS